MVLSTPSPLSHADDVRLEDYRNLRAPSHRAAVESAGSFFIAEGVTVVRRLLQSTLKVRSVLVIEGKESRVADLVPDGTAFFVATKDVMNTLVGFDLHRGVIASAERPPWCSLDEIARSSRLLAVLEGVNDHENLGAIARSARALGVDGMVLDPTTADPWYRRCVRVSMGEILHLPLARATAWPQALHDLRRSGFVVAALTPAHGAVDIGSFASRHHERVALVLGAEGPGLTDAALVMADVRIRIPIRDDVDSLNVGHAAAVAFAALNPLVR